MSILNFPLEVALQILQKHDLFNRINLCMAHSRFFPLCFDKLLDRKFKRTITINELQQLHHQSRTKKESEQCFNPSILDRIRAKNFNEIVHMHMKPENDQFFANQNILHYFRGNIILEGENEQFSEDFYQKFLFLIDRVEENLSLMFLNIKGGSSGNIFGPKLKEMLSKKLNSGKEVFFITICKSIKLVDSLAQQLLEYPDCDCTLYYNVTNDWNSWTHNLMVQKKNGGANVEKMIAVMNHDGLIEAKQNEGLIEAKQHLMRLLPLVKVAELRDADREIQCENCAAGEDTVDNTIALWMLEPAWSNCATCVLN